MLAARVNRVAALRSELFGGAMQNPELAFFTLPRPSRRVGLYVAMVATLLAMAGCTVTSTPTEPPSPAATVTVSAPSVGGDAPQAKVETRRTCRWVIRRYYERPSPLDRWALVAVDRAARAHPCNEERGR